MTVVKQRGRRAAAAPVKTPLTELTEVLRTNSSVVGRRAAVVAAAGGLITAVGLPAATSGDNSDDAVVASADAEAAGDAAEFSNQAKTVVAAPQTEKKDAAVAGAAAASVAKASKAPTPQPSQSSDSSRSSGSDSSNGTSSRSSSKKASRNSDRGSDSAPLPNGSKAQQVLAIAKRYTGVPYSSGGTTPNGWDCSGFTSYVYGKVGVKLPRTSGAQRGAGKVVSRSAAKPGDIIWIPGHVGIYAGNGMMYDAGSKRTNTSYRSASWMMKKGAVFIRVL